MDIKQIRTFLLVAEVGSLSQASDRLRVAQPALSRQVKLLEAEAGVPLFVRHGRGMTLTEAGLRLRDRVSPPLKQLERALDDVRSSDKPAEGNVALGMTPTLSFVLAGRVARRVASELPGVSLRIVEGYGGYLVEWLQRGEIDASLIYGPSADLHLKMTDVLYERLMLVGPRDAPLDIDTPVTLRSLKDTGLVLPSRPHGLRSLVDAAAQKSRTKLNVRFEADSFLVLKDLVQEGLGYTILPTSAFKPAQLQSDFRLAPLVRPQIVRHIVLARSHDYVASRAAEAVQALLLSEIDDLVRRNEWNAYLANN